MNRALVVAVLDALADVETCYRNADAGGVTHAVGRLLGRLDTVAQDGGRLVLTAEQLRSALRHEGAPARSSDVASWIQAHGHELEPWQQHVANYADQLGNQVAIAGLVPARVLLDELVEVTGVVDRADVDEQTGALVLDPADLTHYSVVSPVPDGAVLDLHPDGPRIYMNSGAPIEQPTAQFIVTERVDRPGLYVVGTAPLVELAPAEPPQVIDWTTVTGHDCDDGCSP